MAEDTPDSRAELARARYDDSLKYMSSNVYPKMVEVYQAYQCQTDKIYKKTASGKDTAEEDKSRTNVCMPTISVMVRKNVARLTAQPPNIAYRCTKEEVGQKLTAWSYMQYDRSGEAKQHRKLIAQGELFGWSVGKLYWDTVEYFRQMRQRVMNGDVPAITDRAALLEGAGVTGDALDQYMAQAQSQYGSNLSDQMGPDELSSYIANYGSELVTRQQTKKYEGPCTKVPFNGDFFKQPGAYSLDESEYTIETYKESDLFLQKMVRKTFKHPETGLDVAVFDKKLVQEFVDSNPVAPDKAGDSDDLREQLRKIVGLATPTVEKRLLKRKQFGIWEQHEKREDGTIWISWYGGEGKFFLGEMPYPWDLYGKFGYTEYIPIPDIVSPFGTSMPIILRHLHKLHNVTVGQRTDLVNRVLRRTYVYDRESDIPDEVIERSWGRVLVNKNPTAALAITEPDVPASAWETEGQLRSMMAFAEPGLNTIDSGTAANPQAGKTATTAILNAKSNDVLTQDKMNAINLYLKEHGQKKLWMLQQAMEDDGIQIDKKYIKDKGLSQRYGDTAAITLDPYEIQDDIEVEPQALSMLAVDDELKVDKATKFYTLASQAPDLFDRRYAAELVASTFPDVDLSKALLPDQSGQPQIPETRMNVSLSIAFKDLPHDVQNQLLPMIGLQPSQELALQGTLSGIEKINAAGKAAEELQTPPPPPPGELQGEAQGMKVPHVGQ